MMVLSSMALQGRSGHAAGRELLAQVYRQQTGKDLPPIAVTDRGKPYFIEGNLHFSISHTPRRVFCALAEENIGIDAEELDRQVNPKLADKILSPSERIQFDAAEDQNRALLTFWVLKEAAAKYTGEGLRGYPNRTAFSLDDPAVTQMDGCLVAVITKKEFVSHAF